ncbi:MAG: hypothetical protein H6Q42_2311 [Deltaproteobacteria bacterium]|nr:hypothetical protein [Deltaproteobacteria bacterium]
MILGKGVTPVGFGVPKICNELKQLDSGFPSGSDPGYAAMTEK